MRIPLRCLCKVAIQTEHLTDPFKYSFKTVQRNTSLVVLSAGFQRCTPGYGWGPGVRDHFLLHFIRSGQGQYQVHGKTYRLQAGDIFLVWPGQTAFYQADLSDPWEYVWVGFYGQDALFLLNQAGFSSRQPWLSLSGHTDLAEKMQRIYDYRGSQIHEATRMTGLLYDYLASLIEIARPAGRRHEDPLLIAARTAADFIAANYSQPIAVNEIAAYANTSRSALYRAFRRHFGVSPMQYVIRLRIEQAQSLLRSSDTAVADVARSVGFEDPLYFSRAFRAMTGASPSEFRRQG